MPTEQLQQLLDEVCKNLDSKSEEHRRVRDRLLREFQQLPGLRKSNHLYYSDALDRTWEWGIANICAFKAKPHLPIEESLVRWLNGYLYWRIKDLYGEDQRNFGRELSLDVPIDDDSENPSMFLDQLSGTDFYTPNLNGIDAYIERYRNRKRQKIVNEFEQYVDADPEQRLQTCHPRGNPNCNCQILCKRLLFIFKDPPDTFQSVSRELGITYTTLHYHWNSPCKRLMQEILRDLGYEGEEEL